MKATLSDGTVLEGQPSEIVEAIRELAAKNIGGNGSRLLHPQAQPAVSAVWTEARVQTLWNFLYGRQKELVRFLVKQGGKATIQEVMTELNLKKATEVAGLRSCITRNARRETGNKRAALIAWERDPKGNWHYRIAPEILGYLKKLV